jgi:hypothetical protein
MNNHNVIRPSVITELMASTENLNTKVHEEHGDAM